jgi:hypothetical protein
MPVVSSLSTPVPCPTHCVRPHAHTRYQTWACPECDRPLSSWAGPGHPLPTHYGPLPGVGTWCPEPHTPRCRPCALGTHGQCKGEGCPCPIYVHRVRDKTHG